MKIKKFDKPTLTLLRPKIQEALDQIAKEYDISLSLAGITFDNNTATLKVKAAVKNMNGEFVSEYAQPFKELASLYGLKADDLGKKVIIRNVEYTIVGLAPRSKKYPLLCKQKSNGKTYKFTTVDVVEALKK